MAIKGQRFHLDLTSDEELDHRKSETLHGAQNDHLPFIRDITERPTVMGPGPPPPKLKGSHTGFPEHKKRSKASAFNKQRFGVADVTQWSHPLKNAATPTRNGSNTIPSDRNNDNSDDPERMGIGQDNQERLAQMFPSEIVREREELMSGLSSSLIERLLKRANIDQGRNDTGFEPQHIEPAETGIVGVEECNTQEIYSTASEHPFPLAPGRSLARPVGSRLLRKSALEILPTSSCRSFKTVLDGSYSYRWLTR